MFVQGMAHNEIKLPAVFTSQVAKPCIYFLGTNSAMRGKINAELAIRRPSTPRAQHQKSYRLCQSMLQCVSVSCVRVGVRAGGWVGGWVVVRVRVCVCVSSMSLPGPLVPALSLWFPLLSLCRISPPLRLFFSVNLILCIYRLTCTRAYVPTYLPACMPAYLPTTYLLVVLLYLPAYPQHTYIEKDIKMDRCTGIHKMHMLPKQSVDSRGFKCTWGSKETLFACVLAKNEPDPQPLAVAR